MTRDATPNTAPSGRQALAALSYVAVVAGLALLSIWFVAGFLDRSGAVATARDHLAQLDGRLKPGQPAVDDEAHATGSPFVEGHTITIAGADLQKRVSSAVAKAGGVVLSSQIVIDGPQAKDGFLSLTASIEIAQPQLQSLLYDLEAGLPYLFVDTLAVQSAQALGEGERTPMRVVVGVSGQWQPAQ